MNGQTPFKDEWEDTDEGVTSTHDQTEPLELDPNQDPPGPGLNPCHKASPPPTIFEEGITNGHFNIRGEG